MPFIVESRFSVTPTPEILALVPPETARGRVDAQDLRLRLFLAADQSAGWQSFEVESREELDRARWRHFRLTRIWPTR
jgi:hypothetical protein